MTDLILRIFVRDHKNTEDPAVRDKCGRVAGAVGIVTNFLLFLMKIIVGTAFHSVSVTADAVNNLTDSGSSVVTLIGFKMASKPADEKHPFGHARIEYLSGVIVSFIVIFLGLQLGMSSIEKILTPEENALTPVALVVLVISILAKLWQCLFYRKVGRMIKSESVEATSKDSRNDVIATSVVLLGAVITMLTGVNLDGYMGAAVALFIVFSGVQLTISTADPLLGQAPEGELVQTITEKMLSYPGIIGMHDLAVHNYGVGRCFASAHCEVDAQNDILVSHDLIDNIERDFSRDLGIHMVIHLDPVIVGDARTDALHRKVQSLVTALYPTVTIHDFRVIWGVTHSNIVFDAAVPFAVKDSDAVITMLTGVNLDGYMGAAVALFIVFSGVQLTISTADPLLGQAPEGELVQTITEKMLSYPGIIGMHDLAVHNYGVGRCFASAHCEVDAQNDILVSHDLIDNIERDFSRDLGIHMVIHLDPVIVGDARTDALHRKVQSLVTALYPTVTIHDFRVIWGVTHSNIVFDAAVPFAVKDSDAVITQKLEAEIQKLDPDYRTVVTIDRR